MRKILVLLKLSTVVFLSGCVYQTVDSYDIYRAAIICNGADNIVKISAYALGLEDVECKNGTVISLTRFNQGKE